MVVWGPKGVAGCRHCMLGTMWECGKGRGQGQAGQWVNKGHGEVWGNSKRHCGGRVGIQGEGVLKVGGVGSKGNTEAAWGGEGYTN